MSVPAARKPVVVSVAQARRIWLHAQRLDAHAPFGSGPPATRAAVEHLGYVQIDTIHVVERCHHQILYTRIPDYRREHLHQAQAIDKSVFECWTHALAYAPTRDLRVHLGAMRRNWQGNSGWFGSVTHTDLRRVLARIRAEGALSIRDIDDEALVDKHHPWASRKPSKRALECAFFKGFVTVSERRGMVKTYELIGRHFGWDSPPRLALEREILAHRLDAALRAQGLVSLDSICHLDARRKPAMRRLIEARLRRGELRSAVIDGAEKVPHWALPQVLEAQVDGPGEQVHILSPFDPLVIQRRRLQLLFGCEYRFEAYVPKARRVFGYFAQPVLVGEEIVALIDLKADRERRRLLVPQWTWLIRRGRRAVKPHIEAALHRFERFQFGSASSTQ